MKTKTIFYESTEIKLTFIGQYKGFNNVWKSESGEYWTKGIIGWVIIDQYFST